MSVKFFKILALFIPTFLFVFGCISFAQDTGNSSTTGFILNLPDFASAESPADFIIKIYIYALSIAGALALAMIVYGGIKYALSGGNVGSTSESLDIVKSAVWGIALLAGAYLILNTINPDLTILKNPGWGELKYEIPDKGDNNSNGDSAPGSTRLYFGVAKDRLENYGIKFGFPFCTSGQTSNCVDLEGIRLNTVDGVMSLKDACGDCDIVLNAGTERDNHSVGPHSHMNGFKVDIKTNKVLDDYIMNTFTESGKDKNGNRIFISKYTSGVYTYEKNLKGGGYHWDVFYP